MTNLIIGLIMGFLGGALVTWKIFMSWTRQQREEGALIEQIRDLNLEENEQNELIRDAQTFSSSELSSSALENAHKRKEEIGKERIEIFDQIMGGS